MKRTVQKSSEESFNKVSQCFVHLYLCELQQNTNAVHILSNYYGLQLTPALYCQEGKI